jgi:starvation-inducible DNA-binding protein
MAKKKSQSASPVAEALTGILADTLVLSLKTKNYHWNVTGPMFQSLHTLFQALYEQLDMAGDELAERIRALDAFTPGSYSEYLKISNVKEAVGAPPKAQNMVQDLFEDFKQLSLRCQEGAEIAEKGKDDPTADLLTQRIEAQDKAAWMLKSHIV